MEAFTKKVDIPIEIARKRIATVWYVGSSILFILVTLQTILGLYGDKAQEAWAWLLPTVMPTLFLITSVLVSDALKTSSRSFVVDSYIYTWSFLLSVLYMIAANSTILARPFSEMTPLAMMKLSHLWLGPLQGFVSASIGLFYLSKEEVALEKPVSNL